MIVSLLASFAKIVTVDMPGIDRANGPVIEQDERTLDSSLSSTSSHPEYSLFLYHFS